MRACFFFQAEDGIRDLYVTGVQTCALPICRCHPRANLPADPLVGVVGALRGPRVSEIGRASCRERVLIWAVAVSLKEKAASQGIKSRPRIERICNLAALVAQLTGVRRCLAH